MRTAKWVVLCGLAIVIRCGWPERPIESPSALPAPVSSEPVLSEEALIPDPASCLKTAVIRIYTPGCGFDFIGPEYERCRAVVEAASREELMAVYTDVVSDPAVPSGVVGSVSHRAAELPLVPAFRDALRNRREFVSPTDSCVYGLFKYFAAHGEWADLEWFWKTAERTDNNLQRAAFDAVKKLRTRLVNQAE